MKKQIIGVVSSDKSDKTIVVTMQYHKLHPLYKKSYTVTQRFMAHDPNNDARIGDKVSIVECRPVSANKRFMLLKIINRPIIREDQSVESITADVAPKEVSK